MAEGFYRKKKKVCPMCAGRDVNYKDEYIKKFISNDSKKILPKRMTGACAKHQRHIANEVKKARFMALIPFVKD